MAQKFSIPGQNLTYNLPEVGEVFKTTGDFGTRLFKRTESGIQGIDLTKDVLGVDLSRPGSGFKTQGEASQAALQKLQTQYGLDYSQVPTYDVDETLTALGKITGRFQNPSYISDISQFAIKPVTQTGTTFTQTVSPTNPNQLVVSGAAPQTVPTPAPGAITPPTDISTYRNPNIGFNFAQGTQQQQPNFASQLQTLGINMPNPQDQIQLAAQLGIQNYTGTPEQQAQVLSRIQQNIAKTAPQTGKTAPTTAGTSQKAPTPEQEATAPLLEPDRIFKEYGISGDALSYGFNINPQKTVKELVTEIMDTTGLPDVKKQLTDLTGEINVLNDKKADEIAEANSNPFLSEASRAKKVASIQSRYESKLDNLNDRYTLLNGIYDDARQEAQFAATTAISLYDKNRTFDQGRLEFAITQAEKELESRRKLEAEGILSVSDAKTLGVPFGTTKAEAAKRGIIPRETAIEGQLTPKQTSVAIQLANSLKSHPAYTDMQDIATGLSGVQTGLSQKNGFGDITAINAFQRMVDPGATVREGDVALIQTASAFLDKVLEVYPIEKLQSGAKLPEGTRKQMMKTADELYERRAKNYNDSIGNQYKQLSSGAGIPFEYVGQDFPTVGTTGIGSPPKSFLTDDEMKEALTNPQQTPVVTSISESPSGFFDSFLSVFGLRKK